MIIGKIGDVEIDDAVYRKTETFSRWQDPTIKEYKKEIERLQNIIDELEKYLEEFDFTALICGNRKVGKSIELGARLNNDFILDKLKELKEGNKDE